MNPERMPEKQHPHLRMAAGTQIIQSKHLEIATRNNNTGSLTVSNCHENNLNPLSSSKWRASLVPAAAVIPAPLAYTNIVAVKKFVVDILHQ